MFDKIYTQHYINLPKEVREKLTQIFNIERTGITEIRDQTLISDGTTNGDLQKITIEAMEEYTSTKGTFAELFTNTIIKIEEELYPKPLPEINTQEDGEEYIKTKKQK